MSASIDKEAASLLNAMPAEGATATHLAETTQRGPEQVQKARNVFKFVG